MPLSVALTELAYGIADTAERSARDTDQFVEARRVRRANSGNARSHVQPRLRLHGGQHLEQFVAETPAEAG